jgi:putative ABC transport system substrate-binding protein
MTIIITRREFRTPIDGAATSLTDAPVQRLMKTLRIGLLAMLALLGTSPTSEGQQTNKIPRLCFLTLEPGTLQKRSPRFDAFFQGLRDLGYEDGKSITIDYLSAEDHSERFPALVDECLRRKADVIVPSTTPAAQVAKNATQTVPIVMVALGDPVGTGLVKSLARPEGNITGMAQMVPELAVKRLELLKEAVPAISRVLVLTYLISPIAPLQVKTMKEAAPGLGVSLLVHDIQSADDIPLAFDAAVKEGANGLIVTAESIFVTYRARVSELAAQHRLPAMYPYVIQLDGGAGGLIAYDVVSPDLHTRAAGYVDRILKGEKPADLPVQQPSKFELVVNLKTAKALDLTIPPNVLARANAVIE